MRFSRLSFLASRGRQPPEGALRGLTPPARQHPDIGPLLCESVPAAEFVRIQPHRGGAECLRIPPPTRHPRSGRFPLMDVSRRKTIQTEKWAGTLGGGAASLPLSFYGPSPPRGRARHPRGRK